MHHSLLASRRMNLPPVATNRVHFIRPDEFTVHRLLRTIALNTTLSRLSPGVCCAPTHWLMPAAADGQYFPHAAPWRIRAVLPLHAIPTGAFENTFPTFRQLSDGGASISSRTKPTEVPSHATGRCR